MYFGIHRFQKAGVTLAAALLLTTGIANSQNSFTEAYLSKNLSQGPENAEQINAEASVTLLDRRILEFRFQGDNFQEFEVVHRKVKIFDSEAQSAYSELYVPLNKVEEVFFIKAKATSPNGSVTETDISKIKTVEEDGEQYKLLAVEGVQIGGTVEYCYGVRKKPNIYRSYFLGNNSRILQAEYWIICPKNIFMEHKVFNTDKFEKKDSVLTVNTVDSDMLIYTFKNIPATYFLGKTFPSAPMKYRIESSIRRNKSRSNGINYEYNDIARITNDAITIQREKGLKEIKKIASKIGVDESKSEREKIIAIESYVKRNFSKISIDDEAANTIQFLVANKSGNDDAILALYTGLFEYFGIKYEMGFAYDRTVKFIDDDFENWANLDQWIARFPNSDTYIMPLDIFSPPGYLNNDYRGSNMIRIKTLKVGDITSAVADLVKIPDGPLMKQKESIKISFNSDLEPSAKYEYKITGHTAAGLKWIWDYTFDEPSVITSVIKDLAEKRYEDMEVSNITFKFDENYGSNDFWMSIFFNTKTEGLVDKAGDNLVIHPCKNYNSIFVGTDIPADYSYAIQAKENTTVEYQMEIPIPAGYKAELNEDANFTSSMDFGNGRSVSLKVNTVVEGDKVMVKIEEEQKVGRLDIADLKKLQQFISSIKKVEKLYFVLSKA